MIGCFLCRPHEGTNSNVYLVHISGTRGSCAMRVMFWCLSSSCRASGSMSVSLLETVVKPWNERWPYILQQNSTKGMMFHKNFHNHVIHNVWPSSSNLNQLDYHVWATIERERPTNSFTIVKTLYKATIVDIIATMNKNHLTSYAVHH